MLLLLVGMSGGNLSLVLTVVGIFTRLLGADVDIVRIRQTLPTQDARERYSKWENPEASRQGYENTLG